ncbi:MAG TPA: oxidoreductase, partial [Thermoanaerobaculia bacterium]|nr:oxidoreductase [Thermoanaerobaculia bacterium]
MTTFASDDTTATAIDATTMKERVAAATELLEAIDRDRGLLAQLTAAERQRFLQATRIVSDPDPRSRRRLAKASRRERKAALAQQEEQVLSSTGIRELRRKPVFTTPNYYLSQAARDPEPDASARTTEARHCYVCKQHYQTVHHFYDQLCPACGDFNFRKRT